MSYIMTLIEFDNTLFIKYPDLYKLWKKNSIKLFCEIISFNAKTYNPFGETETLMDYIEKNVDMHLFWLL